MLYFFLSNECGFISSIKIILLNPYGVNIIIAIWKLYIVNCIKCCYNDSCTVISNSATIIVEKERKGALFFFAEINNKLRTT